MKLKPKKRDIATIRLQEGEMMKLVSPLHVFLDDGCYWVEKFDKNLIIELCMTPMVGDCSLNRKTVYGRMIGIKGQYVGN